MDSKDGLDQENFSLNQGTFFILKKGTVEVSAPSCAPSVNYSSFH